MNARTPDEKAIWVAVYAGECVWSRRAAETTDLRGAYRAAENAVMGYRASEETAKAAAAEVLAAAEMARKSEKQAEAQRGARR